MDFIAANLVTQANDVAAGIVGEEKAEWPILRAQEQVAGKQWCGWMILYLDLECPKLVSRFIQNRQIFVGVLPKPE
jgi:hypothetical protein